MRVEPARVIKTGIPRASAPPAAPGEIIAILAVRIARFPGCTKDALAVPVPGQSGVSCQRKKQGRAEDFEFHHMFLQSNAGCEHTISARLRRAGWTEGLL